MFPPFDLSFPLPQPSGYKITEIKDRKLLKKRLFLREIFISFIFSKKLLLYKDIFFLLEIFQGELYDGLKERKRAKCMKVSNVAVKNSSNCGICFQLALL